MMLSDSFKHGLAVLRHIAGSNLNLDFELVNQKEALAASNPEASSENWFTNPMTYLVLQDMIPRSHDVAERWKGLSDKYLPLTDINHLITDEEIDPHLLQDLSRLHEAVRDSGFNPSASTTTTRDRLDHLIIFGTGDGRFIQKIIERYQPIYLTVVVTEWEDWASSFNNIDWGKIWNERCINPDQSIFALKVSDAQSLAAYLADINLPFLDHAACYCSPSSSDSLRQVYEDFNSELLSRVLQYTGFIIDEYNMIWNSWKSLLKEPRIYHKPIDPIATQSKCIVCGSGPSLDLLLPSLKELSKTHLVIACASNFGTLRRYGISVDVLCLLERGDFMVEQYKAIVNQYGGEGTRLLASVTTPAEIQDLFEESMVYFRPALTPLSVFANSPRQVLSNEGPQTINTGISFAVEIGASTILLAGVDLGTTNRDVVRSKDAIGNSPREFPIECAGNLVSIAYTNNLLLDGKLVAERVAAAIDKESRELYNASNGILLDGFTPINIEEYINKVEGFLDSVDSREDKSLSLQEWWYRQPRYKSSHFIAKWIAGNPRRYVSELIRSLQLLVKSNIEWSPHLCAEICKLLKCTDVSQVEQFPRRIMRGHFLKLLVAINRQLIIMSNEQEKSRIFEQKAREILYNRLADVEVEIYSLIDAIEACHTV